MLVTKKLISAFAAISKIGPTWPKNDLAEDLH